MKIWKILCIYIYILDEFVVKPYAFNIHVNLHQGIYLSIIYYNIYIELHGLCFCCLHHTRRNTLPSTTPSLFAAKIVHVSNSHIIPKAKCVLEWFENRCLPHRLATWATDDIVGSHSITCDRHWVESEECHLTIDHRTESLNPDRGTIWNNSCWFKWGTPKI